MNIAIVGLMAVCALAAPGCGSAPAKAADTQAILNASGYVGPQKDPLAHLVLRISGPIWDETWESDGSITVRDPEGGEHFLCLGGRTADGRLCYSDCIKVRLELGKTLVQALELKPGLRLDGRLDASVPRPVRRGRVIALAGLDEQTIPNAHIIEPQVAPGWVATADIDADGRFSFPSLPRGTVELLAYTEGYFTRNPPSAASDVVCPQVFLLDGKGSEVEVAMEPRSTCEMTVLDPQGLRLANAGIAVRQAIAWRQGRHSVIEDFQNGNLNETPSLDSPRFLMHRFSFHFVSGADGVVRMPGLLGRQKGAYAIGYPLSEPQGPAVKAPSLTAEGTFDLTPGAPLALSVQVHDNPDKPAR